jgi:hypothetical protein
MVEHVQSYRRNTGLAATLQVLADDLDRINSGVGPTEADLARAPILFDWEPKLTPTHEPAIRGVVRGHPAIPMENFYARRFWRSIPTFRGSGHGRDFFALRSHPRNPRRDRAGMTSRGVPVWLRKLGIKPPIKLQKNKDFGFYRTEIEELLSAQKRTNARRFAKFDAVPDNPRTRVLRAVAAGKNTRLAAKEVGVIYGTAHRWVSEWRATGNWGNKQPRSQLKDHREWLDKLVATTRQ